MEKVDHKNRIECRVNAAGVLGIRCGTSGQRCILDGTVHSAAEQEDQGGKQRNKEMGRQYLNIHTSV